MADLKSLVPVDTYTFEIKNPVDGEVLTKDNGKPMTITIFSPYSDTYKKVAHAQAKKRLTRNKSGENKELTIEDYEDFAISTLAETTSGWDIQFEKKPLPFSTDKAKEIYRMLPWLIDQVKDAQDHVTNFFKV